MTRRTLAISAAVLWQCFIWYRYSTLRNHLASGTTTAAAITTVINLSIPVILVIFLLQRNARRLDLLVAFLFSILTLTVNFSNLYWLYGYPPNFNFHLSHLDGVYFSLGTLSTAGTGNISATSEVTRGIQSIQMALDLILLTFVAALVLARLTTRSAKSPAITPDDSIRPPSP